MTTQKPTPLLPLHDAYAESLLDFHWAAQIVAAASGALEAKADWSHTNLLVEADALGSRPLPDGRRVFLEPATLTLRSRGAAFLLAGQTMASGMAWLSEVLRCHVARLEHALPPRPLEKRFESNGGEAQVLAWFAAAHRVLDEVRVEHGGGEVRLWPHHFDMATLIELDEGASTDEDARSINVGLSPGDGSYAEPYFYITPWPTPKGERPQLEQGHWHTEGFTAAVLPASEMDTADPEEQARRFVKLAIAACHKALG